MANKRKTRGGRKSVVRKTRRNRSFFGFSNQRQESESSKTAAIAGLALVPFENTSTPHNAAVPAYNGGRRSGHR